LAWGDVTRFRQQILIGFENLVITAAVAGAIYGFGDLPKSVARLHCVEFWFWGFLSGCEVLLDGGFA
jgi:hypothetical protein